MPFEIDLGQRLIGFALSSARKGEMAPFVYRGVHVHRGWSVFHRKVGEPTSFHN